MNFPKNILLEYDYLARENHVKIFSFKKTLFFASLVKINLGFTEYLLKLLACLEFPRAKMLIAKMIYRTASP